jgi:AcrR family transcriptional regulator
MQRARQPGQKDERRRAIVQAALALWRESTFDEFTMSTLAARLGLAKGTLYLYFETKEEVILAVLEHLLDGWLLELAAAFRRQRRPVSPRDIAEAILVSLQTRRELIRLLPSVETLLDRGASDQAALAFERRVLALMNIAGTALEDCFSTMMPGSGIRLLLILRALIMGMYLRANKPERIRQMLAQHEDLRAFDVRFDREFVFAAEALIGGFVALTRRQVPENSQMAK